QGGGVRRFMDFHIYLWRRVTLVDGGEYVRAGLHGPRRERRAIRPLSLHSLEPHALDDRGDASAHHYDVAEPRCGKRSAGSGAGFQSESEERNNAGGTNSQTA